MIRGTIHEANTRLKSLYRQTLDPLPDRTPTEEKVANLGIPLSPPIQVSSRLRKWERKKSSLIAE